MRQGGDLPVQKLIAQLYRDVSELLFGIGNFAVLDGGFGDQVTCTPGFKFIQKDSEVFPGSIRLRREPLLDNLPQRADA